MTVTRLEVSDQDLVAAVRDGNDAAFDELYTRHGLRSPPTCAECCTTTRGGRT